MIRADFEKILIALGQDLDIPLKPEKNAEVDVKIDDILRVSIKLDKSEQNIILGSFVTVLPPGKFKENVFIQTLKYNAQVASNSSFGYNEKSSELTLFEFISLDGLDKEKLLSHFSNFIETGIAWKQAVESSQAAPTEFLNSFSKKTSSLFDI